MAYYPLEFILLSINALVVENKPLVIRVEGTAWVGASPPSVVKSLTSETLMQPKRRSRCCCPLPLLPQTVEIAELSLK